MIMMNNLSGVTYRVVITKIGDLDPLKRLFYMTTADEAANKK